MSAYAKNFRRLIKNSLQRQSQDDIFSNVICKESEISCDLKHLPEYFHSPNTYVKILKKVKSAQQLLVYRLGGYPILVASISGQDVKRYQQDK